MSHTFLKATRSVLASPPHSSDCYPWRTALPLLLRGLGLEVELGHGPVEHIRELVPSLAASSHAAVPSSRSVTASFASWSSISTSWRPKAHPRSRRTCSTRSGRRRGRGRHALWPASGAIAQLGGGWSCRPRGRAGLACETVTRGPAATTPATSVGHGSAQKGCHEKWSPEWVDL